MVDETAVGETAVDEIAVDEPGPHAPSSSNCLGSQAAISPLESSRVTPSRSREPGRRERREGY